MKLSIHIQAGDFSLDAETEALARGGASGAIVSFTGHVRREGDLAHLTLEHYPRMTEAEIARIAEEAAARWPLTGITVIHRIGRLAPGERIVLAAVASPHRQAAFAACEFVMDYLKTHAPFWKEEARGSERHWVAGRASDDEAAARWRK